MKEQLLQLKQDIVDISNDLTANLADKGVEATGTLSELVNQVKDIKGGYNPLAEIGWNLSEQPFLKDAIEYAQDILANPKSNYQNDKQLVIFPKVDELVFQPRMFIASNLTLFPDGVNLSGSLYYLCQNCYSLMNMDLTNGIFSGDAQSAFYNCYKLKSIGNPNLDQITNFNQTFYNCNKLESIPTIDITDVTNTYNMLYECNSIKSVTIKGDYSKLTSNSAMFSGCDSLEYLSVPDDFPIIGGKYDYGIIAGIKVPKILGSFDYSRVQSYESSYYYWVCGFDRNNYTRYMLIKNIGYYQSGSYLNMEYSQVWGIANDEVPDARQSLIDSLITYSFDRAAAGYSTMTMKLYKDVKALLTDEEIAQITAKGYTLI